MISDLKPANLLLSESLRVKITDFGFAQLRQIVHQREEQPRGSVFWMPPELLMGKPWSSAVDLFSFGVVLWQLVTRRVLYAGKYTEIAPFVRAVCVEHERPALRPEEIEQSPRLARLMRRAWHPDPEKVIIIFFFHFFFHFFFFFFFFFCVLHPNSAKRNILL